jgi:hypothetical protein
MTRANPPWRASPHQHGELFGQKKPRSPLHCVDRFGLALAGSQEFLPRFTIRSGCLACGAAYEIQPLAKIEIDVLA